MGLLFAAIAKFVIPEIMDIVRKRAAANAGKIPTNEEVAADFIKEVTGGIEKGTSWLDSHPAQ